MRRTVIPELLDSDAGTPAEIAAQLAELRLINRRLGGISTMTSLLRRVAQKSGRRQLSLLDVAGASGDVARGAAQQLAREGIELSAVVSDRSASHLGNGLPTVAADALALPFADGAFDVVGCSLFAHHLEPEDITRFVREALRVARLAVVVNDLRRSALHLAGVYLAFPLFSRMGRHDAVASVRRAYNADEMRDMLASSGRPVEVFDSYFFRMGAIVWNA